MELTVQIKEKDYMHYTMMHMRKWRSVYYHIALFSLCIIVGSFALINSADRPLGIDRIVGILLFSLTTFYFLVLILLYFRIKSEYKSNLYLKSTSTYQFTEHGFTITTPISNANISWESLVKVKQSKKLLALYISNSQAYLFPKDQLNNSQKSELTNILKSNLPNTKFKYKLLE